MEALDVGYFELLHFLLGHDRCCDYLGLPRSDRVDCLLCRENR